MNIVKAEYINDYKIKLLFDDNKQKTVDFGGFILNSSYAVFNQYKDLKKFKGFKLENGNIVWGKDWDLIFPLEQLYAGKIKLPKKNFEPSHSLCLSDVAFLLLLLELFVQNDLTASLEFQGTLFYLSQDSAKKYECATAEYL